MNGAKKKQITSENRWTLKNQRVGFYVHISRMDNNRLTRKIFEKCNGLKTVSKCQRRGLQNTNKTKWH